MDTINHKAASHVTKEEALAFCYENEDKFVRMASTVAEGKEEFDALITILESDTIAPVNLPDYGMSDQELE